MTDRINKLMYILDRSEEVLKLTQILAPFFCFTFCTSPPYRVKYPPVCLKGQISTLQRNRSMEGGVQVQSKKKSVKIYIFLQPRSISTFFQYCVKWYNLSRYAKKKIFQVILSFQSINLS